MAAQTKYDLVNLLFDGRFAEVFRQKRVEGASFRDISLWLYTDHGVNVTEVALREWWAKKVNVPPSVA